MWLLSQFFNQLLMNASFIALPTLRLELTLMWGHRGFGGFTINKLIRGVRNAGEISYATPEILWNPQKSWNLQAMYFVFFRLLVVIYHILHLPTGTCLWAAATVSFFFTSSPLHFIAIDEIRTEFVKSPPIVRQFNSRLNLWLKGNQPTNSRPITLLVVNDLTALRRAILNRNQLGQGWKWVGWPGQSGSLFGESSARSSGSHPLTKLSGCDPDITFSVLASGS